MINLVITRQLRDKGYFDEDLTLWEIMKEVKEEVAETGIWGFGAKFDISCDNGILNWNGEYYDFGFKNLRHRADEIRGIIKDIHDCLDKHNSTHIDIFFPKEGIVILLSTEEQIDSALFYKSYETVGQDSKGYRQVTNHYNSTDLVTPLQIALDFDYVIHEKTVFKWDMFMDDNGLRDLLKECTKESKNVNYSYSDVRTEREIAEDKRKQKQEEQERKQQAQQEQQQEYDKQLQQMLEQFEETKRQMMLLMGRYMSEQQQEEEFEEDDDFEDFEDDDE